MDNNTLSEIFVQLGPVGSGNFQSKFKVKFSRYLTIETIDWLLRRMSVLNDTSF